MLDAITSPLSGLRAASTKVAVSAENIANINTTGNLEGGKAPYTPKTVQQQTTATGGVATDIALKNPAFIPAFDPSSPFANADGLVGTPNVDMAEEFVNIQLAKTNYKASASVIRTVSDMQDDLLKTVDKKV